MIARLGLFLLTLVAGLVLSTVALAAGRAPDLVLTGVLSGADHETYREVPFQAPRDLARLTVEFEFTGRSEHSVIDLGLRDPTRFRGWSGGNKSRLVIEEADATPSYLPGPLPAGTWRLVLGAPNIRKTAHADYVARIWFDRAGADNPGFQPVPVRSAPGWYRGDLHMHTAHSDGTCASRRGAPVPCPVFRTLEAAVARGLDFISVTDHNATSQDQSLRELAPYFDDLLLIPGREITTFRGHANVFGPTTFLDFQLGGPRALSLDRILDEVRAAHGLVSVNHPGLPSGEICMGCGWTAQTDWSRIAAIEVENGGAIAAFGPEGGFSGIGLWERQLDAGRRITAIGGSDNHDASLDPAKAGAIGAPTTVVRADQLSQSAILDGIARGHVFVDIGGGRGSLLEVAATTGAARAEMGDELPAAAGQIVSVEVHVAGVPAGARLALAGDGAGLVAPADLVLGATEARRTLNMNADGKAHWLRIDVRNEHGALILLGNPIYLRPPA